MAKTAKNRRRLLSRRHRSNPYPTPQPCCWDPREQFNLKKTPLSEKKDWDEATCSVCMEFPHNAVLLLCSSHDNGCRPYMCATSHRHSNCLEQFKQAHTKVRRPEYGFLDGSPTRLNPTAPRWPLLELSCPLCRGQVKGWTVVESARKYLNDKKRSCMQDGCAFMGTYKELKKHVKSEHPCAKPREIDPEVEERWRVFVLESERRDVMSTIMSSMPRSMVYGDYVIEMNNGVGVAGAGEDEAGYEDPPLLNRNILYVLREGARLMRLQWDDDSMSDVDGVADVGGAVVGGVDGSRADGPIRRRRRRRSRGPVPDDV